MCVLCVPSVSGEAYARVVDVCFCVICVASSMHVCACLRWMCFMTVCAVCSMCKCRGLCVSGRCVFLSCVYGDRWLVHMCVQELLHT